MAWIESHQSLAAHRKTKKLKRLLTISTPEAVGHLHLLWWWCLDNTPDGDLTGIDSRDIAEAAEWGGEPQAFLDALVESEFVDRDTMALHDWYDYAGKLIDRREKNARYQREHRERETTRKAYVSTTSDLRKGATVPNSTQPNSTKENTPCSPPSKKGDTSAASTISPEYIPVIIPTEKETAKKPSGDSKATSEAEFLEYVEETKGEFPDLDCEEEFKKFQLYWTEGRKKLLRPKLAWRNWLVKAREIRNGTGPPGNLSALVKNRQERSGNGFNNEQTSTAGRRGLPGNRPAGAFADLAERDKDL